MDPPIGAFDMHKTLPELARLALQTFPADAGGTPAILGLDTLFASMLVRYWNGKSDSNRARVSSPSDDPSDFEVFAWDMFSRVGRKSNRGNDLTESSLKKILSAAIRAVKNEQPPAR